MLLLCLKILTPTATGVRSYSLPWPKSCLHNVAPAYFSHPTLFSPHSIHPSPTNFLLFLEHNQLFPTFSTFSHAVSWNVVLSGWVLHVFGTSDLDLICSERSVLILLLPIYFFLALITICNYFIISLLLISQEITSSKRWSPSVYFTCESEKVNERMKEATEAEFTKNEVMKKNGGKDFEKSSI